MNIIFDKLDEIIYQAKVIKDNLEDYKKALRTIRQISNNRCLTVYKRNEQITNIINELLEEE